MYGIVKLVCKKSGSIFGVYKNISELFFLQRVCCCSVYIYFNKFNKTAGCHQVTRILRQLRNSKQWQYSGLRWPTRIRVMYPNVPTCPKMSQLYNLIFRYTIFIRFFFILNRYLYSIHFRNILNFKNISDSRGYKNILN